MENLIYFFLFIIGLGLGSFINVLGVRYDPDRSVFKASSYEGRSHCPHCGKTLAWYELVPLLSYVIQLGKCRSCNAPLSIQYFIVELVTGLLFAYIPMRLISLVALPSLELGSAYLYATIAFWLLFALIAVLISIIDLKHQIIPDELNALVLLLGLALVGLHFGGSAADEVSGSLLGSYALIFGSLSDSGKALLISRMLGFMLGIAFYGGIIIATRGRAMGMGDLKLSAALGMFIGWPDLLISTGLAFVTGSLLSIGLILMKGKTLKDMIPFGPFILAGVFLVFFCGQEILRGYFSLFGLLEF